MNVDRFDYHSRKILDSVFNRAFQRIRNRIQRRSHLEYDVKVDIYSVALRNDSDSASFACMFENIRKSIRELSGNELGNTVTLHR